MKDSVTVIIHTLNEEKNILRAIKSAQWANEILICDMHSEDKTVEIARKEGARIIYHEKTGFVEPARNFAISKATNKWIFILDADEEVPDTLVRKIAEITNSEDKADYVNIPRKNIIFGEWLQASGWWPDYNIRLFQKGKVTWSNKIHSKPETIGKAFDVPAQEELAIIHYHYNNISQYLVRLNQYTDVQAQELNEDKIVFSWKDVIHKPLSEFLSRYFVNYGYKDGFYGLALCLLQAFSFLVVYLKLWEIQKHNVQEIAPQMVYQEIKIAEKQIFYWFDYIGVIKNPFKFILKKIRRS